MTAPSTQAGDVIDRQFRLVRSLGQGGMGEVFLAEQLHMRREVVVKVMHAHLQHESASFRGRFQQEAEAIARLNHPNIVQIYACGETEQGTPYLAMEFVAGRNLKQELRERGRLSEREVVSIAEQICAALEEAHERGVVHRDLKPENVMLARRHGRDDFVKVLDFGIAKVASDDDRRLTQTGMVFGTPHYMSPEQARGQAVDARSDLYALGLMLYEMLTGVLAFDGDGAFTIALKQVSEPAPLVREQAPEASAAMEAIIARCLEKQAEARFASAAALRAALAQLDPHAGAQEAPALAAHSPLQAPSGAAAVPTRPRQQRHVLTIGERGITTHVEDVPEDEEDEEPEQAEPEREREKPGGFWRSAASDLYDTFKTIVFIMLLFSGFAISFASDRERWQEVLRDLVSQARLMVGMEDTENLEKEAAPVVTPGPAK